MSRFEAAFGKWVVRQRWRIIVGTILAVFAAASGMRFLTINNDTRVFLGAENPQLQALEALENTYTKDQIVFFSVAPTDGNDFTRETLAAVEELTRTSWQMPYSRRVDSLTNFQHTRVEEDDLIVEDLVRNARSLSDADLKRIRRVALSEPFLLNSLISPSGHVTGVNVIVLMPGKSLAEVPEVMAFARKAVQDLCQKHPEVDVHLTGSVIMDNAFGEVTQKDMSTLIPLMFLVLIVVVGLSLRSILGTITTLIVILFSMVTGLGLAGWLRISLTAASVNAPTLILTLAVADSVHILVTMFHFMRSGKSKHEAIAESLRINLRAVFLTSFTTAIGFLTMNFSDVPPFRDLGNIVAMGVMAAFAYSVLSLPALLAVLPVRIRAGVGQTNTTCRSCEGLANFLIHRRKLVFWGMLVVIVGLSFGILRIDLNDNFLEYFDESHDMRRATDFILKNLTGWDMIEYSLESGEPGGINNPAYLAKVEEFASWYRKQPGVVYVRTITDTMKRLNRNMHGDDGDYYRIPEARDLAAQYLLLYEMSLPFGLDLNNQINVDKSSTRMTVGLKAMSATEVREMDARARQWLEANAPENMFTHGTGLSVIWAHITERNIRNMLGASFWALVLISVILIFALRSFKIGLVSLIPNLVPAFMAFGVWGMVVGEVGLSLSILVSMTIGIVVDDTVHFLSKYMRARREQAMDPPDAVRYAFNTVGTAMWVTTIALVAGFLVLTLSSFRMNSDMGMMTAMTITFALVMDFLLLPTLLMKVEGKG